jgi:hypothetical protein
VIAMFFIFLRNIPMHRCNLAPPRLLNIIALITVC